MRWFLLGQPYLFQKQHTMTDSPHRPVQITAHTVEAMRATVAELMKRMPTGNCKNCGAVNPAIRRCRLLPLESSGKCHLPCVLHMTSTDGPCS